MILQIILWTGALILCLAALSKSADIFTANSEKIGLAFGLSSFVIGATIVAIGTSLPELVTSMFALFDSGTTEFVADTIVGSNIANVLLIFGIGAIIAKRFRVETSLIDVDLPFFFLSMAIYVYFSLDQQISRWEGVFLLVLFVIFILYSIKSGDTAEEKKLDKEELADVKKAFKGTKADMGKYILWIVGSGAVVAISSKYLITSVLMLSELAGISSSILTVILVALGTSLPEVVTSLAAVRRSNYGIAIGNALGSNIFNFLLVGGFPALFMDLAISGTVFTVALPFVVIVTFATIFVLFDDEVRPWEGAALLFLYLVFLGKTINIL